MVKLFDDRAHAGRRLAAALARTHGDLFHPAVIAGSPGGIVVGYALANALGAPLDVHVDHSDSTDHPGDRWTDRECLYRHGRPRVDLVGRTAIVVDDGAMATAQLVAMLRAVRDREPDRLLLALPVCSCTDALRRSADDVLCLAPADPACKCYREFAIVSDAIVIDLLERSFLESVDSLLAAG